MPQNPIHPSHVSGDQDADPRDPYPGLDGSLSPAQGHAEASHAGEYGRYTAQSGQHGLDQDNQPIHSIDPATGDDAWAAEAGPVEDEFDPGRTSQYGRLHDGQEAQDTAFTEDHDARSETIRKKLSNLGFYAAMGTLVLGGVGFVAYQAGMFSPRAEVAVSQSQRAAFPPVPPGTAVPSALARTVSTGQEPVGLEATIVSQRPADMAGPVLRSGAVITPTPEAAPTPTVEESKSETAAKAISPS